MLQTGKVDKAEVEQNSVVIQKKNYKSVDRLKQWLTENGFLVKRFPNSELMKFLEKCPLSPNGRHLTVHSTTYKDGEITLVLKDGPLIICFKLVKIEEGFMIKTTNELAWLFSTRGNFIKRIEHKKVKVWLAQFNIDYNDNNKSDLQKFLEKCPICGYEKLLRFRRSYSETILDLQCKCSQNFRLKYFGSIESPKEDDYFSFTYSGEILKNFDKSGTEIQKKEEKKLKEKKTKKKDK